MTAVATHHRAPKVLGTTALFESPGAVFGAAQSETIAVRMAETDVLAGLYLAGVRRLALPPEDAAGDSGQDEVWRRLRSALGRFNRLLLSRGLAPIRLRCLPAEAAARRGLGALSGAPENPGRRRLMGRATAAIESTVPAAGPSNSARLQELGRDRDGVLFAAVPVIDAMRCTGCDACIRICPADALSLDKDRGGQLRYRSAPEVCTGCQLCVEVCDTDAIGIVESAQASDDLDLVQQHCRACGVPFHEPAERAGREEVCRICRRTRHHSRLFQVLPD